MNHSHNTLAWSLLVAAVACGGDSTDVEVTACSASTGSVTVTVDLTGDPVFAWDPDCAVTALIVEDSEDGGDVWFIESSPTLANLISPPITYGTTSLPAGVQATFGPDPLVSGTSYDLIILMLVDPAIKTCPDLFLITCRVAVHQFTR